MYWRKALRIGFYPLTERGGGLMHNQNDFEASILRYSGCIMLWLFTKTTTMQWKDIFSHHFNNNDWVVDCCIWNILRHPPVCVVRKRRGDVTAPGWNLENKAQGLACFIQSASMFFFFFLFFFFLSDKLYGLLLTRLQPSLFIYDLHHSKLPGVQSQLNPLNQATQQTLNTKTTRCSLLQERFSLCQVVK